MAILRIRFVPVFVLFVVLANAQPARAQAIEDSFRADILKLLEVTGSEKMAVQMATSITNGFMDAFKKGRPDIPPRALDIATEVLNSELTKAIGGPDGLVASIVPIYAKHLTRDDVRGLIAFYTSDLGKRTISLMPQIMQESMAAGQQWAEKQMPRITSVLDARLRAEGIIK